MDLRSILKVVQNGASVVDVRPLDAFAEAHLAGAIYVAWNRRSLPGVLRACVAPGDLVLIAPSDAMAEAARRLVPVEDGYRILECVTVGEGGMAALGCPLESLALVTGDELAGRLDDAGRAYGLLDVREPFEWRLGVIEGSTLLSLRDVRASAAGWDPDRELVCVCEEGFRSASAASLLRRCGFRAVASLAGGIAAWFSAGRPLREP